MGVMTAYHVWLISDSTWSGLHDWDFVAEKKEGAVSEPKPQWHTPLYATEGFVQTVAEPEGEAQESPPAVTERRLQALWAAYLRWPYSAGEQDGFPLADVPAALKELYDALNGERSL